LEAACLALVWSLSVIVCLAGCLLVGGSFSRNCILIVCSLFVWLAACSSQAACLEIELSLFVYCLSGCLLVRSCLLADIAYSLSVWLAACSSVVAFLKNVCSFSVYCLSGLLPSRRRLLVWKLIIYGMFLVCLAGCLLAGGCLSSYCSCIVC
jgi:hypothetical protein